MLTSGKPGKRDPILSDEQREALNTALSGAFSSVNSFGVEGGKTKEENDPSQQHRAELRGVPPPLERVHSSGHGRLERKASSPTKKGALGSGGGERPPHQPKVYHDHHLSRKTKGSGKAKKDGAGGKFTWGSMFENQAALEYQHSLDKNDPNWDSGDDIESFLDDVDGSISLVEAKLVDIAAYKDAVFDVLIEYFVSGDVEEAAQSIEELEHPEFAHFFVKKAIVLALDRHDKEREMVSRLLSEMYERGISPAEMETGFVATVDALEDLVLDVPQAVEWVSQFTCRAIADDILPPSLVKDVSGDAGDGWAGWAGAGPSVRSWYTLCNTYLSDPHFAERMQRVWGGDAGLSVRETKKVFMSAIKEYMSAQDIGEVRRALHELAVPHYHHEFVCLTLQACFENPEKFEVLMWMLGALVEAGDVNKTQKFIGLKRVAVDLMDQVLLDYPNAKELFLRALEYGAEKKWIAEGSRKGLLGLVKEARDSVENTSVRAPKSVNEFKAMCRLLILEHFESGDQSEVEFQLKQAADPGLHSVFVKMLIQMAMDRSDREREMASSLLADLSQASVVSEEQIGMGFSKLLSATEDLTLDIPDAPRMLTMFLGRAIVDEIISPSFLAHADANIGSGKLGTDICIAVKKLLAAKHSAERFTTGWHGYSLHETSEALSNAFVNMVKEYMDSKNLEELLKCLKDAGMPHYHHELVYQCIVLALDSSSQSAGEIIFELLAKLFMVGGY